MKWPKIIFKSNWLVVGAGQIIILNLYYFGNETLAQLLWWQLLTPLLWLAFWLVLWGFSAMWYSLVESVRKGNKKRDRHMLAIARIELERVVHADPMGKEARGLRKKIRKIELRMMARAKGHSRLE